MKKGRDKITRKRSAQLFGTFDDLFDSVQNALELTSVGPMEEMRFDGRNQYHKRSAFDRFSMRF